MRSEGPVLRVISSVLRRKERLMSKLLCAICICLATVPALCQSMGNYQVERSLTSSFIEPRLMPLPMSSAMK